MGKKSNIFVYGLFRDQAKGLLGEVKFIGKDSIKGKMYRVNEFYPGFKEGDGLVYGDVYSFDEDNLPVLDLYEGDEYVREKIVTSLGRTCWVYKFKYNVDDKLIIKGGDWMLR